MNIEEEINQISKNSLTKETPEEHHLQLNKLSDCEKMILELRPSLDEFELKAKNIDKLLINSTDSIDSDLMDKVQLTNQTVEDLKAHIEILKKSTTVILSVLLCDLPKNGTVSFCKNFQTIKN